MRSQQSRPRPEELKQPLEIDVDIECPTSGVVIGAVNEEERTLFKVEAIVHAMTRFRGQWLQVGKAMAASC